jgi:hypothetical protein
VEDRAYREEEDAMHVDRLVQVTCGVGGPGVGRPQEWGGGARGWLSL